ncbi:MAG TPA: hypothetical protein VE129_11600 [Thermoanaerobaculia bacterium]|nr:hypothetical protein [Thermoanaerobaculia bacterium]
MLSPLLKALLPGAILAAFLGASPAAGKDSYKGSLDPAIPHHAAILDTLSKIEKAPVDGALYNDLGCLVAWDGFWRDALRNFDTAAGLAPKDSRPSFNAGLVEALRGDWGGARSRFRKAVKTDPGNWPGWWMLGFAEEMLGHEGAAVDAYSRALRVDTSLFDPKVNPFAVATRLRARVLLETYPRRRVDAVLPFSNQLSDPSRVASFFQHRTKAPKGVVEIEEPPRTGPVVTSVPPPAVVRPPVTLQSPVDPLTRRRKAYSGSPGSEREAPIEVSPAPSREAPAEKEPAASPVSPGPGFGTGSGAPGTGGLAVPAPGGSMRRVPAPAPASPTPPPDGE